MFLADHVATRLRTMPAGQVSAATGLMGVRVHLFSAIARPDTFEQTVAELGAEIVGHTRRRDHHRHTPDELAAVAAQAEAAAAIVLTTEKDEVKLDGAATARTVLELDLRFLGEAPELDWLLARDVQVP
jgi:tetraacyldisaccharide-1-P 4'-kinase